MDIKPDVKNANDLFREVCKAKYGNELNYPLLENKLGRLKKGGVLTYEDLDEIANPDIWPFNDYWCWPAKEQIEKELNETNGLFENLDNLRPEHEKRISEEVPVIKKLYDIFKHIELVSIILRFVDSQNYAIYSPPVARILNSPRGTDYVSEYLNYLENLRKWRDFYNFERVAEVDMFLWALEEGNKTNEIMRFFHRRFSEENIQKITIEDFLKDVLRGSDLERAKFYLKIGEYDTAAKWAGSAFERAINDKCRKYGITSYRNPIMSLSKKAKKLTNKFNLNSDELWKCKDFRDKAFHTNRRFTPDEVTKMINKTEEIQSDKR